MKLVIEPHILENAFAKKSPIHMSLTLELYSLFKTAKRFRELLHENAGAKPAGVRIFISYKRADRDFMEIVRKNVKDEGYDYWLDEERLKGGEKWREEIKKEIGRATLFLSLLSNFACLSDGVFQEELREALAQQKERKGIFIIPLLHDAVDVPYELKDLNPLYLSNPKWMEDVQQQIREKLKEKRDVAEFQQLSKPEVCVDNKPGDSMILRNYRDKFRTNKEFEDWRRRVESVSGFCHVPPIIDPLLERDLEILKAESKDKKGCRQDGSEIYVRTALGARDGHLVSEGGVEGKCRQKHKWDTCPTANLLRSQRGDFVLSANTALSRVEELTESLKSKNKELRRSKKVSN